MNVPDDSGIGYIVQCDLHYDDSLHDYTSDFPLAPDHLKITADMLSEYQKSFLTDMKWSPCQKLAPNLYDKVEYVVHYRNLKFYVEQGLVITKIHRVLQFTEKNWLVPWL
jgi:hypothetical protein